MISDRAIDELDRVGATRIEAALGQPELERLISWSDRLESGRPGERVRDPQTLNWLLADGIVGALARSAVGDRARPVRAILFDKTAANNWALGWHQDRTIAVNKRFDTAGFDKWNVKAGIQHVEPPFEFIERMITARIHIDAVDEGNAPLLIAPGSHRFGKIVESEIEPVAGRCGEMACLAHAGDAWLYSTAILHASRRATGSGRRRVLQVDFSADELPGGLQWAD